MLVRLTDINELDNSNTKPIVGLKASDEWYIRSMQPDDEGPFLSFLSAWIKEAPVKERYQWIYQNNPDGKAVTWVAVEKKTDRLVGCTSVFPRKMWMHDRIELGSIGADTYVDPLWRRKGIAEGLHRYSLKGMCENGIRLEFGFPLYENLRAFCKAGAHLPGNFVSGRLFLSVKPFLSKLKLNSLVPESGLRVLDRVFQKVTSPKAFEPNDRKYCTGEFNTFDESFDSLSREISPLFKICCLRDCSYLRWRFLDNPFRKYTLIKVERKVDGRLEGFAALEVFGENVHISELFARPQDDILEALLSSVIRFGIGQSLRSVSLVTNPAGPYRHNLALYRFRFARSDQRVLEVLGDSGKDGLEDLANWYITFADVDN
jgi:hypothetical protein